MTEKRIRSFTSDTDTDSVLDDLAWGKRSRFVNEAIRHYAELAPSAEEAAEDFREEEAFRPPTQPRGSPTRTPPASGSGSSGAGRTASGDPETSASDTTSESEPKQSTRRLLMTYSPSEDSKPGRSSGG